jgi:hypothetical protein
MRALRALGKLVTRAGGLLAFQPSDVTRRKAKWNAAERRLKKLGAPVVAEAPQDAPRPTRQQLAAATELIRNGKYGAQQLEAAKIALNLWSPARALKALGASDELIKASFWDVRDYQKLLDAVNDRAQQTAHPGDQQDF